MKKELTDLYKQNAINNQQLIEANATLSESEKKLATLFLEYFFSVIIKVANFYFF